MPVQQARSYAKLAVAIITAAVLVSATIIGTAILQRTTTLTSISTVTAAAAGTQTSSATTSSGLSTSCMIPDEGDLVMKVVNSSTGTPIGAVPVQVENLYPECPPNPHTIQDIGTMDTNGSGILLLGGLGEDYLNVTYGRQSYSVNASIGPESTTCVTLGIPSGDLSVSYSRPFQTSCGSVTGSSTSTLSGSSSPTTGGVTTTTTTMTTTVDYPVGTTTITQCSSTGSVTVTLMEGSSSQVSSTVTTTATSTATNYGYTATRTDCAAVTVTTTVTQTG